MNRRQGTGEKRMECIAVLGPKGTFCDQAMAEYRHKTGRALDAVYCPSIDAVFGAVERTCHCGIVPVENTLDGYVQETLDRLLETDARIVGEVQVPVQFALVGNVEQLKDIRRLYVQFKAKQQCSRLLATLPEAGLVLTESNMESYRQAQRGQPGEAAIVPKHMCAQSGCAFKRENVTDAAQNFTRFFVLDDRPAPPRDLTHTKSRTALYVIDAADRPGTLYEILKQFAQNDINLAALMSRPTKKGMGTYNFYLEVSCQGAQYAVLQRVLAALQTTVSLKVLGAYATP